MEKVDFNLKGRIALITGASRGIGEAVAVTLADYGAHCILVSRKEDALNAVAGKITDRGGTAGVMTCNMGDLKQIETLIPRVRERYGALHILVNNAAANPYFGEMLGVDEGIWNKTFDVNLKGPFFLIKQAAPLMTESGGGAIVNISSVSGVRPPAYQGIYAITKAGLLSMTQAFAKELATRNIRVNAVLPGLVATHFSRVIVENPEIRDMAVGMTPMGRHAVPREIAGVVLYLVSDAASFATGAGFVVDGGYLA
jgi:NAD(P)-dependent dehydrogenase (short-subunit alcohol dehydrogenase family)